MAVRKSKRGAPAAHAPAAAEPSPSSPSAAGKRMRLQDCSETVSKEERFIVRLSEVLRVQGGGEVAALRTVSAVHEALASAIQALPDAKPLKAKLQSDLKGYGDILAKHLGITEPEATGSCKGPASKQPAPAGQCGLVLDRIYLNRLENAASLDSAELEAMLIARTPAPKELVRRSIDRSGGSVAALEAAISLMAALTPLATSRAEGCGRWAAGIAEMAEEAMKDAVAGKGDLQRLSRALDRYFAGQAVRQLRYQVQQPEEGNEDRRSLGLGLRSGWAKEGSADRAALKEAEAACGGLVMARVQLAAIQNGLMADGSSTCLSPGNSVESVSTELPRDAARNIGILGAPAWLHIARLLLEPRLPMPGVGEVSRAAEDRLWMVLNRGLEMSAQQVYDGTSEDEHTHVRVYLSCILVGKRALARTRTQRAPLRSGNLPGTSAMVSGPPPNAFCAWLRSQPLSHAVAAALDVLEREPKDLTSHLLLRAQDIVVSRLLRSWEEPDDMNNDLQDKVEQAEDVHDEAAAEAVAQGEEEQDDGLFFVDTKGEVQSHFGRWGKEDGDGEDSGDEDEDEESNDNAEEKEEEDVPGRKAEPSEDDEEQSEDDD